MVGTDKGKIYSIDAGLGVTAFYEFPSSDYAITSIASNDSIVWVLTNNKGLFAIDVKTKSIMKEYVFFSTLESELVPAKALYVHGEDVWIGTQRGLYVINTLDDSYVNYVYSKQNKFGLPNSSVWTIYEDQQRNLWIGTYAGGLCYVDFAGDSRFESYIYDKTELNNNLVSCFAEDAEYLWVGTEGGGINCVDKETGEFVHYTHKYGEQSLSYDNVKSLVLDKDSRLWIGMYQGGIDCFDTKNKTFTNYKNEMQCNVKKIILEKDSGLWCANQTNQYVSFFRFSDKKWQHHEVKGNGVIVDMCRGLENDLWIATVDELFRLDVSTKDMMSCLSQKGNLRIETIAIDDGGMLWIGTIDAGLLKYNPKNNSLSCYDWILQYDVYVIYSICFDGAGNPWLGTDNGLFKLDVGIETFQRFDESDGIQGCTFYPKSCLEGIDGSLFFGGMNGYTVVYPKKVRVQSFKPRVVISDFYLNNKSVTMYEEDSPLEQGIELTDSIILSHVNENFGFRFFSNNYINAGKNRFRYRLRGYERAWVEVDASHNIVHYAKVPAGEYVFEVLAANSDGVWNEEPTSIYVKRLPSPFRTWWAYSLYIILFMFVLFVIGLYYSRQKRLKMDLYVENLKAQEQEIVHQSQLRFFTNISHEFRTPLFLMLAALEHFKKENMSGRYLQLFEQNTNRLLKLINELMDFRTVENGQLKLRIEKMDINMLVEFLAKDFLFYAADKGIMFSIKLDAVLNSVSLCGDRQIMEKIILNLLNNAFKFTERGGNISIETYSRALDFKPTYVNSHQEGRNIEETDFCIVVRDTGVGISKESIADIFVRFYKVDNSNGRHMGSGIGLALVRSLVLLHEGVIKVYSERGIGTEFVVAFSREEWIYGQAKDVKGASNGMVLETISGDVIGGRLVVDSIKQTASASSEKKTILVVEDNEEIRFAIHDILLDYFDVIEAIDGVDALNKLDAERHVDMLISDVMMPRKDGITLCQELKSDVNFSHIPIIMLTAKSGIESHIEGINAGADAYFEKPVNLKLLLATIQNLFLQRQKIKDYYAKNYFADSLSLATNKRDNEFIEKLTEIIELNIERTDIDVNYIAAQLSMSRSKLYGKIKSMTDKSIVEFVRSYRLRKAAKLLAEENLSINEAMSRVGFESDSYFSKSFKMEFGQTPSEFVKQLRDRGKNC